MTKVYVVTQGDYSDYHILAVFLSKEKAEEFMSYYPTHGFGMLNDLEEYDADEPIKFPKGKFLYWVEFSIDGNEMRPSIVQPVEEKCVSAKVRKGLVSGTYTTSCWARDEMEAIKIANDRRRQAIAEGAI